MSQPMKKDVAYVTPGAKKNLWRGLAAAFSTRSGKLKKLRALLLQSGLFDSDYYRAAHPDLQNMTEAPIDHYLEHGFRQNRDPNPYFSANYYLSQNPDVAAAGANPLLHFVLHGAAEGRRPNPVFDPRYYQETYASIIPPGMNPLAHYIKQGVKAVLNPAADFDADFYLRQNRDVAKSGIDPLLHYLTSGAKEGRNADSSYQSWVRLHDTLLPENEQLVAELSAALRTKPLFSVLLYVEAGSNGLLTIDALKRQIYDRFELIVLAPGDDQATLKALRDSAGTSSHIKIIPLEDSLSPQADPEVEALNQALHLSSGDYIVPLKSGELPRPHALFAFAWELNRKDALKLVYADHDIMRGGARENPFFKPDFNPDLLLEYNYIGSFFAVHARFLKELGGFHSMAGEHYYDLLLRCAELDAHISHLPFVLHHSTENISQKHLQNKGVALKTYVEENKLPAATVLRNANGTKLLFEVPKPEPFVTLIVPTRNRVDILKPCIESILAKTSYQHYEILIVDNSSDDERTLAYLKAVSANPRVRIALHPGEFNYSAINNTAVALARGSIVGLLNNDIEVSDGEWLTLMVAHASRPEIGAVGAKLVYPNGKCQHCGVILGVQGLASNAFTGLAASEPGYMGRALLNQNVSAVTAACLLVRKELYLQVGGLDDINLKVAFNDVDFCLKVRAAGFRNLLLAQTTLVHHESVSRGPDIERSDTRQRCHEENLVMRSRWGTLLYSDPAYNKNLDLNTADYRLGFPPRTSAPWRLEPYKREGFTALSRDDRLNIYGTQSNLARVEHCLREIACPAIQPHEPGLSVIILTKDHPELIIPLVRQLLSQEPAFLANNLGYEILIGDTGTSNQEVLSFYTAQASPVQIHTGLQYNFSACNNQMARHARFDTFLFLNNDIVLTENNSLLLTAFNRLNQSRGAGCLGAVMFYPDHKVQHAGCEFLTENALWGLPYHVLHRQIAKPGQIAPSRVFPCITGAFLLVKRQLFELAGRFDETYKAECQDAALCLELHRLGYSASCEDLGHVVHIENATRPKNEENWEDRRRFLRKYSAYIRSAYP